MSIPAYQFPSLATENEAKRRVIKTAKKGVETEEQRAIRSGKIDDNIKNIYKTIIANLELQLSLLQVGNALGVQVIGEGGVNIDAVDDFMASKVIGTLGKLVRLSSQLKVLVNSLREMSTSKRPTYDTSKIVDLIKEIDSERGVFGVDGNGFGQVIGAVTEAIIQQELLPNDIYKLEELYTKNTTEALQSLSELERNEYQTNLESIYLPIRKGRYVNPDRVAEIASGAERRTVSGAEYRLLLNLRNQGILHGDDFTSVYSGASGSSGSIGSSEDSGSTYYVEESDSDDDTASSASSGLQLGALMRGDLAGYGLSGGAVYSIPLQPKRVLNMASGYAYPLRYY
jgi:hypothetical protein